MNDQSTKIEAIPLTKEEIEGKNILIVEDIYDSG